jgi:hypothetical protein
MKQRPISVIIISCLYIVTGIVGLAYHLSQYKLSGPFQYNILLIALVEIVAIVAGIYMLRRSNWARWLAAAWIGFHVIISIHDPWQKLTVHAVLFVVITFFLFRRPENAYFRGQKQQSYKG